MGILAFPPYALECALAFAAFLLYYYIRSPFTYWKKRGVAQVDVPPIIGNTLRRLREPALEAAQAGYNEFPDEKIVGNFEFWSPTLVIRDPDLIDTILVKDFEYLTIRGAQADPNSFLAKNLLNLSGSHWKSIRSKLNPIFSSGKLKAMHSQLVACGDSLLKFMECFEDGASFDARNVIQRFSMDVIASCAFGLNIDTINDPESQFRKMGMAVFNPSLFTKLLVVFRFKTLTSLSGFDKLFSKQRNTMNYFVDVLNQTIEFRKKNKIVRPDFLQLTHELMEKDQELISNKQIKPDDQAIFDHSSLTSNAFVFFLAGFETTATTVSYAMYELALNLDVQDRLYDDVSKVLAKHNGVPDYAAIQDMTYVGQVISETLRKYPPAYSLSRKVTKEYQLPEKNLTLPVGMYVRIPTYALHHDPQYFPDPEKFIPERFDKDKNIIRKGTYLPFGGGPRVCIAARFAKLEANLCLAMIINKYKISPCNETQVPLKFSPHGILLTPEKPLMMKITKR